MIPASSMSFLYLIYVSKNANYSMQIISRFFEPVSNDFQDLYVRLIRVFKSGGVHKDDRTAVVGVRASYRSNTRLVADELAVLLGSNVDKLGQ